MSISNQKTLSVTFLFLYSLVLLAVPIFAQAATFDIPCKPTEYSANQAPTTGTVNNTDLFDCVNQLYKYALIISSIAAVFMIIIAGYMYIFSGGDSGKVGTAKSFITTSLLGITVLLTGFLLLKQINPNLLVLKNLTPQQIGQRPWERIGNGGIINGTTDTTPRGTGPSTGVQPGDVAGANGVTCNGGVDKHPDRNVNCSCFASEITRAVSGVGFDPSSADGKKMAALIRAVLYQETNCGQIRGDTSNGAGVMQIKATTAAGNGCPANWVANDEANILCGAKALKKFFSQGQYGTKYILATYNGGDVSQQASAHCPGMKKFECPFDNVAHTVCNAGVGSYETTRNYIISGMRFFEQAQACTN